MRAHPAGRTLVPRRPVSLELGMATYIVKKHLLERKEMFPFTLMLEPLELCNLACNGCGHIQEYKDVFDKRLTVEHCLQAAEDCGAPIVNIPGGEPLIHKQIGEIVQGIINQGRFVYLCTNGILMNRAFEKIAAQKRFAFVVHIDGMESVHDHAVDRQGVFKKATAHIREAIARGYRVCTNTTIFRGTPAQEYVDLFAYLKGMGVEGCITSSGYDYESVTHNREQFLARTDTQKLYSEVHELCEGLDIPFYNNPLFHEFLQGKREYRCSAWSMPTYTVQGWRSPCYMLADTHMATIKELFEDTDWEAYGTGRDPRCANCLMHCGYEASTILDAFSKPKDLLALARG